MIVDSNVLTEDVLREHLSRSRKNIAVVTDYLMIEALKGDPLSKIFRLMKILCEFPKQVIVLKSMRSLGALKGRPCGMTRRMIDREQTKGFSSWCVGLKRAEAGDNNLRNQLVENGKEATEEIDHLTANQATYAEVIADEAKNYTAQELKILRTDQPYTSEMIDKMAERVVTLTTKFLDAHPDKPKPPTAAELPYTYLFRLALCAYLQTLRRIQDGGPGAAKAENIANDIIDAVFAAIATYFQGLLSNDAKANELYRNAKHILKGFPVAPEVFRRAIRDALASVALAL
jgi:hypothetical protein